MRSSSGKLQAHVHRCAHRVVIVRLALDESEALVQLPRLRHPLERVELELAIADAARVVDAPAREPAAPMTAARVRLNVQPLDLRDARVLAERSQRDASECLRGRAD